MSPPRYAALGAKGSPLFGYSEELSDDRGYVLKTVYPNSDMAQRFWDRRAQELCGGDDFKKQIFRQERPTVRYDSYGGRAGHFVLEGFLRCDLDDGELVPVDGEAPDASE